MRGPIRRPDPLLVILLVLAFLPRLIWPTLAEFKLDEATVVRRAMEIAWKGGSRSPGWAHPSGWPTSSSPST